MLFRSRLANNRARAAPKDVPNAEAGLESPVSAFGTSLGASWFMRIRLQRWATTPTQCNPEGWLGSACQGPKDGRSEVSLGANVGFRRIGPALAGKLRVGRAFALCARRCW